MRIRGRSKVHGGDETCNIYDAAHKPLRKVDSSGLGHRGRWTIVGRVTKKSEVGL